MKSIVINIVVVVLVLAATASATVTSSKADADMKKKLASLPMDHFYVYTTNDKDAKIFTAPQTKFNNVTNPVPTATIDYTHGRMVIGWDVLNVTTARHNEYTDLEKAYAAGFGEGYASAQSIWEVWLDMFALHPNGTFKKNAIPPKLADFLNENVLWMKAQVDANAATDDYWYQVGLLLKQVFGMVDGYKKAQQQHHNTVKPHNNTASAYPPMPPMGELTATDFFMGVSEGDTTDLFTALNISFMQDWTRMTKVEYASWFSKRTHCSALIKVADDLSDLYFGHATWGTYNFMIRVYKHQNLFYDPARGTKATQMSFSSYAAAISSVDDFYVLDTGLAVMETTFNVFNTSVYMGNIGTDKLLYWVRVMVANRMATDSKSWAHTFARHNSGTYNNQWMALDLNKFTPGQGFAADGALYIAEQMPGLVAIHDVTATLETGLYWPSYNVPSDPQVYDLMGYPHAKKQQGPEMNSYENNVRAQIFRRDQGKIASMKDFKHIMQYNDYEKDPISQKNPIYAVASRGDLLKDYKQCFGAIDAKVSSFKTFFAKATEREVLAYSGPTPQQPLFDYGNTTVQDMMCFPHYGQPMRYDFQWVSFLP